MSNDIVFTLFEGSYHLGAGALLNSVVNSGFKGDFYLVHREQPPVWFEPARESIANHGVQLKALQTSESKHLAQVKASVALNLMEEHGSCSKVFYFDPDIVVKRNWAFFEKWTEFGVCLVEEVVKRRMSADHPQRMLWKEWAEEKGFVVKRTLGKYFNSGFFAFRREHCDFLEHWNAVLTHRHNDGIEVNVAGGYSQKFDDQDDPLQAFSTWDQDAMNLALMMSDLPLSTMGPEEMDFLPAGTTMSHAVGSRKPWNRSYLRDALVGFPPQTVDKVFWNNAQFPIRLFSARHLTQKQIAVKLASLVGRVYCRG
ncbi:hypothetical protein Mal15_51220 [Stieleria maiorica]|uniref:Uncharacterized protein n=1 Tax=Stieleria maiorica TaxID=2795974 RepID=A0A5B9MN99_9BACT|nr:hypothetical protein [Stieleria maiorica]QEG01046.1 hypothetical protein Mal15_51220 [Stieleria maiorica]